MERLIDINPLALNMVHLLVMRGGLGMIDDIADEYQLLLDSYHGVEQAEVITAVGLDSEDKLRLSKRLSTIVDKKVELKPRVDSSLIGGILVRVGGKLIDGSTRSRLLALEKKVVSKER